MIIEKDILEAVTERASTTKGVDMDKIQSLLDDVNSLYNTNEMLEKQGLYFDIKLLKNKPTTKKKSNTVTDTGTKKSTIKKRLAKKK